MGDKQIEYSVFCIENVVKQLGKTGSELFQILNSSGLLHSYIIPSYDKIFHLQKIQENNSFYMHQNLNYNLYQKNFF